MNELPNFNNFVVIMSTSSLLYRRYLALCNQWGIDSTKTGRDFGHYLRTKINTLFPQGEFSEVKDITALDKKISAFERLANNKYYKPTIVNSSASGLTVEECQNILGTESLKYLEELDKKGIIGRIKLSFGGIKYSEINRKVATEK